MQLTFMQILVVIEAVKAKIDREKQELRKRGMDEEFYNSTELEIRFLKAALKKLRKAAQ